MNMTQRTPENKYKPRCRLINKPSKIDNQKHSNKICKTQPNEDLSNSPNRLYRCATSPQNSKFTRIKHIDLLMNKNPFLRHEKRKQELGLHLEDFNVNKVMNNNVNDLSFDERCYQDIDTSALMKQREDNEAQLEEIEDSISDVIGGTNSITTKTTNHKTDTEEDKPLAMRANCFSRQFKKSDIHDIKAVEKDSPSKYNQNKSSNGNFKQKHRYNYHRLPKKGKNTPKNKDIYEYLNSTELQNFKTKDELVRSRRIERIEKNKAFQDTIQNDNKNEMIKAISQVSFTNQTEMFDHFDSQDEESKEILNDLKDEIGDENVAAEINNFRSSFLNLKTKKSKFFEKEESEEFISTINDRTAIEEINDSMADMIRNTHFDREIYYSFDNKGKSRDV